jgi:hypothetical protein
MSRFLVIFLICVVFGCASDPGLTLEERSMIIEATSNPDGRAIFHVKNWTDAGSAVEVAIRIVEQDAGHVSVILPDDAPAEAFNVLSALRPTQWRRNVPDDPEYRLQRDTLLIRELTLDGNEGIFRALKGPVVKKNSVGCGAGYDIPLRRHDGAWSSTGRVTVSVC